jgi:GNAT superfamily N-acetyltransferase
MTVAIRMAEASDVPIIATLIHKLAVYEKLESLVEMTEDELATGLFGPRPYAEAMIAEDDGLPVAFALFFHTFSTFLARPGIYLEDLFVEESHRGKGIGRALLARLARLALERGCRRLEWAVLDWNKDAIGFYDRLGAKPNSEWTVYRLAGDSLARLAGQ